MVLYKKLAGKVRNYYRFIVLGDRFVIDIRRWFSDNGDKTLRLDYQLSRDSIVFDVGGYEGAWAENIFAKFSCKIFVFEPVPEFAAAIQERFAGERSINVRPYGLSNRDGELTIGLCGDGSSFYLRNSSRVTQAKVRKFNFDLLRELGVSRIDLMKINIEGGEYELLDVMIENGTVRLIRNLQIQFHNFVPGAIERREGIRRKLELTHTETWSYEFVWENWVLKDAALLVNIALSAH